MKKFDINKWRKEQKALHKKENIQESKSPIRNKKKLTEEQKKLLKEQVEYQTAAGWWGMNHFSGGPTTYTGYLYVCPGDGDPIETYYMSSADDPSSSGYYIQNYINSQQESGVFATNYYNNAGGYVMAGQMGTNTTGRWVTPMDVIHYCLQYPNEELNIDASGVSKLKCNLIFGGDSYATNPSPCGGMWVGDNNNLSFALNSSNFGDSNLDGSGTSSPSNGFYNGLMNFATFGFYWGAAQDPMGPTGSTQELVVDTIGSPATFHLPAVLGLAGAQNNCQGPNGACDDSWYRFGCVDTASTNYNDQDTTNTLGSGIYVDASDSLTYTSGGTLLSAYYTGLSGGGADALSHTFTQDPTTGLYTTTGNSVSTSTGGVQGCGTDGIADPDNINCCKFVGCPTLTNSVIPIINYGIWDPLDGAAPITDSNNLTDTNNYNASWIANNFQLIGCPDVAASPTLTEPNFLDQTSCCKVVGCPPNGADPLVGRKTMQYEDGNGWSKQAPEEWYNAGSLSYDANFQSTAIIGCDTLDMVTTGTGSPTGIPDPNDFSCCEPILPTDLDVGCHDATAANYNIHIEDYTSITAAGCRNLAIPNQADPTNYDCCNYEGCPDANLHPVTSLNLSTNPGFVNSGGTNPGITYALTDLTIVDTTGTFNLGLQYQMEFDSNGGYGCVDVNGDVIQGDYDCCNYPNFGCPDANAYNYDDGGTDIEGCSIDTAILGVAYTIFDTNIATNTLCCEYLGCFTESYTSLAINFGPTTGDSTTIPPFENIVPISGIDSFGFPEEWQMVGGNDGCQNTDNTVSLDPTNSDCCVVPGCTNPNSTNYWEEANYDDGSCVMGGCMDNTTGFFVDDNGSTIEYYLASNYNPTATECNNLPDDLSCCKYYTCDDPAANNAFYDVGIISFFIPANSISHNFDPASTKDIGCVPKDYDIDAVNSWDFFTTPEGPPSIEAQPGSNWCCAYKGCSHVDARNFDASVVPLYQTGGDTTDFYWGCNIDVLYQTTFTSDDVSFDCCSYVGCSDITNTVLDQSTLWDIVTNVFLPLYGTATPTGWSQTDIENFYYSSVTCESGFDNNSWGPDNIIPGQQNEHDCCTYEGCLDPTAINDVSYLLPTGGTGGCNGTIGDNSCCEFVGCPDNGGQNSTPSQAPGIGANNYGTFAVWNAPHLATGVGPTEGIFGCSGDGGITIIDDEIDPDYYGCCSYDVGCTDPLAVAGQPSGPWSWGTHCVGCNYDTNAIACYTDNSNLSNSMKLPLGWANGLVMDNGIDSPAYGILNPSDIVWEDGTSHPQCCNYQLGCPDPNSPAYHLGNIGCESGTIPNTPAEDDGINGTSPLNPMYSCCDPSYHMGCTDPEANDYDSSASTCCENPVTAGECDPAGNFACCDYAGKYSCSDPTAALTDLNTNLVNSAPAGWNNTDITSNPDSLPLTAVFAHPFSGILQPDYITTNSITLDTNQPDINNNGQSPYWCLEIYEDNIPPYTSNPVLVTHPGCTGYYALGCDGFPGGTQTDDCCVYDYACPTPGSDSYNGTGPTGYSALGCSSDKDLSLLDSNKFIGYPDEDDKTCCKWTNQDEIGCNDSNAFNYLGTAIGCQTSISTAPDPTLGGNCCQYVYGCTHPDNILAYSYGSTPGPHGDNYGDNDHLVPNALGCNPGTTSVAQSNVTPVSGNYECCLFDYGCHKQWDSNLAVGSTGYLLPFIIATSTNTPSDGYHVDHKGCNPDDPNNFTPSNVMPVDTNECCNYRYGCADDSFDSYDNTLGHHHGCDPTNNAAPTGPFPPEDTNLSCCGDYTYNCVDPTAVNYYITLGGSIPWGCADTNDSSYDDQTSGTSSDPQPNILNLNCCKYEYACADTNANIDYRVNTINTIFSNSDNPGCNPNVDSNDVTPDYEEADINHTKCCTYMYGCSDATATNPGADGYCSQIVYTTQIDCLTNFGTWTPASNLGCNPDDPTNTTPSNIEPLISNTDCCLQKYGCTDEDAITDNLTTYLLPHKYLSTNNGCHPDSDSNGTSNGLDATIGSIQAHRLWTIQTDLNKSPDPSNKFCCKYEYNCSDNLSTTFDDNIVIVLPGGPNPTGVLQGCDTNGPIQPNQPIGFNYPDASDFSCCEYAYGCTDSSVGVINFDPLANGCADTNIGYSYLYSNYGNTVGVGTLPPNAANYSCCDYGCGDTNQMGFITYWPGMWDANTTINQAGASQLMPFMNDYLYDASTSNPIVVPALENSVCCIDTAAPGWVSNTPTSYTYAYVWESGTACNDCSDLGPSFHQMSCVDDGPVCEKCCLNLSLAMASNGQLNTNVNATFQNADVILIQGLMPGGASQNPPFYPYDPNNQATWDLYTVAPYIYQNPMNAQNVDNLGCACLDLNGNTDGDIVETDCWSGWEIGCSPPCLDTNDVQNISPYDTNLLGTQLGDLLGAIYGPLWTSTGLDANCGCHIFDSNYVDTECGPVSSWDPTEVICPSVKVWDSAACACDYPCPRDYCWCHEPDQTIIDTAVAVATAWCCADPTTGIIHEMDPGGTIPVQSHYTLIYPTDHPGGIWTLKNNWLGCPQIEHSGGTTSWGHFDGVGANDAADKSTTPGGTFYPSSPVWTAPYDPIPMNPNMMIIPCDASCSNPYNSEMAMSTAEWPTYQPVNQYNDSAGDPGGQYPIAYWNCGCPDIHNIPFPMQDIYLDFTSIGHTFGAGDEIDMNQPDWDHGLLGCPYNGQPNPIPYQNPSVASISNFLSPPANAQVAASFDCCVPIDPALQWTVYGCSKTQYTYDQLHTDANGFQHQSYSGDPIKTTGNANWAGTNFSNLYTGGVMWDSNANGCDDGSGVPNPDDESCCSPDISDTSWPGSPYNPCRLNVTGANGNFINAYNASSEAHCGKCAFAEIQNGTNLFSYQEYIPGGVTTPPLPMYPNGKNACRCCEGEWCAGRAKVYASGKASSHETYQYGGAPTSTSVITYVEDNTNGPNVGWGKDFNSINWGSGNTGTVGNVKLSTSPDPVYPSRITHNSINNLGSYKYYDFYCVSGTGAGGSTSAQPQNIGCSLSFTCEDWWNSALNNSSPSTNSNCEVEDATDYPNGNMCGFSGLKMANPNLINTYKDLLRKLSSMTIDELSLPIGEAQCQSLYPNIDKEKWSETKENTQIITLINKQMDNSRDDEETEKLQRSLEYYEELISFCSSLESSTPEYCSKLSKEESPYLDPLSNECIKCQEPSEPSIKEQEVATPIYPTDNSEEEKNLCDCCPPAPEKDGEDIEFKDTNVLEPVTTRPTEPEKDPVVEPVVEPEKAEEKTPEEIEYERKTKEYERKKSELQAKGWKEGDIPVEYENPEEYETRTIKNQDDVEVTFHRKRPLDPIIPTEPEITPDDFTLPTEPVTEPTAPPAEEPKITTSELKQMVKNAIREIKKDLKNKR